MLFTDREEPGGFALERRGVSLGCVDSTVPEEFPDVEVAGVRRGILELWWEDE